MLRTFKGMVNGKFMVPHGTLFMHIGGSCATHSKRSFLALTLTRFAVNPLRISSKITLAQLQKIALRSVMSSKWVCGLSGACLPHSVGGPGHLGAISQMMKWQP